MKFISILAATIALPLLAKSNNEDDLSTMIIESTFRGQGDDICIYSPNTLCFPSTAGFPTCCNTLGGDCKNGARTPKDLQCEASICTPRVGCYKSNNGAPYCCKQNGGSGCTIYNPPGKCDVPVGPPPAPYGSNVCSLPPNPKCYRRFGGYPRCCKTTKTCSQQGFTPSNPPPCDTGLDGAFEDQLAEFDAEFDVVYDEDIEGNMDVDSFETQGYLRG